ncbi:hypothetical protein [Streptomyces sp. NPDC005485]|uniref:hypothetical protein n=1 Tax=Streptomyces sp. NPDC005485 TaxID=3155591 RepID=UPI0033BE94B6
MGTGTERRGGVDPCRIGVSARIKKRADSGSGDGGPGGKRLYGALGLLGSRVEGVATLS